MGIVDEKDVTVIVPCKDKTGEAESSQTSLNVLDRLNILGVHEVVKLNGDLRYGSKQFVRRAPEHIELSPFDIDFE